MFSTFSSQKVILVLSDGLGYDVAVSEMGFLMHLVESKLASLYKVVGELPTLSRPMYKTIHTGTTVMEHGIYSNGIVRRSKMPNIFQLAVEAGKTTAAAAYYWFSDLYNHAPYDRIDDREVELVRADFLVDLVEVHGRVDDDPRAGARATRDANVTEQRVIEHADVLRDIHLLVRQYHVGVLREPGI